jgi:hypothetical protein
VLVDSRMWCLDTVAVLPWVPIVKVARSERTRHRHSLNPCLVQEVQRHEMAGQRRYWRRAMLVLESIQLTHVSLGPSPTRSKSGKTSSAHRSRATPPETAIGTVYGSPRTRGPLDPSIGLRPAKHNCRSDRRLGVRADPWGHGCRGVVMRGYRLSVDVGARRRSSVRE